MRLAVRKLRVSNERRSKVDARTDDSLLTPETHISWVMRFAASSI